MVEQLARRVLCPLLEAAKNFLVTNPVPRNQFSVPRNDEAFPGAKMFPGTRAAFLGASDPFLGTPNNFPGATGLLGTALSFPGTRKFHVTLVGAHNSGP